MIVQWEYKFERINRRFEGEDKWFIAILNGYGAEGWELVHIDPQDENLYLFKRMRIGS